ncbi:MAG: DUF167 domain-containing protein [Gammaproteobacteria bacterium]|nr:DUF167 domain-containing protein [Gammaproteobacteria bacterium]
MRTHPPVRIEVVFRPRACGDEVLGWADGALRIRIAANGGRGRVDAAVANLLAEVLGVPRSGVRVAPGRGARRRWVELSDCDEGLLERRLPGREAAAEPAWRTPRHASMLSAVQPAVRLRSRGRLPVQRRGTTD